MSSADEGERLSRRDALRRIARVPGVIAGIAGAFLAGGCQVSRHRGRVKKDPRSPGGGTNITYTYQPYTRYGSWYYVNYNNYRNSPY